MISTIEQQRCVRSPDGAVAMVDEQAGGVLKEARGGLRIGSLSFEANNFSVS